MKKGLFGGTFNPVHTGHVRLTQALLNDFPLDRVIVVPTARPPHKPSGYIADPSDRFHMVGLAFENIAGVSVSDVEMRRTGPCYTIDTVRHFLSSDPESSFYLILGLDAFLELDTWKSYMSLVASLPLIVFTRTLDHASEKTAFEAFLTATISTAYRFSENQAAYIHPTLYPVFFYTARHFDISATDIRDRIKAGLPIKRLVPEPVAQYIRKKGLYV